MYITVYISHAWQTISIQINMSNNNNEKSGENKKKSRMARKRKTKEIKSPTKIPIQLHFGE